MPDLRTIKARARRQLHRAMQVAAYYIPDPDQPSAYVEAKVRVHYRMTTFGDLEGARNGAYMQMQEIEPRLVFLLEDGIDPVRNAVVTIRPGEAYRIQDVELEDFITVKAFCTALSAADMAGLPYPQPEGSGT